MTAPRQWTVAIGVVMALVFGTALAIKIRPQVDLLGVGSTAPAFHATNLRTGRPTTLADYRGKLGLGFDILHDQTGAIKQAYQATGVPESWVINRDGVIVKKVIGASEWDGPVNETLIRRLIDDRPR